MSKIVDEVYKLVSDEILKLGYEIYDISFKNVHNEDNLNIVIEKDNEYLNINDCMKVNDAVSLILEKNDITLGKKYNLNISTAGIDKELKTDKHFQMNIGKLVDIQTYSNILDKKCKRLDVMLLSYNEDMLEVEYKNKKFNINKKDIVKVKQAVVFEED